MRILLLSAVSICLIGGSAIAAPLPKVPAPKVIDGGAKLIWTLRPDANNIRALSNDNGARSGSGTVECTINAAGRPKDCVVTAAEGNGFGRFITELAGLFKAASADVDGKPSAGRKVQLTYTLGTVMLHP